MRASDVRFTARRVAVAQAALLLAFLALAARAAHLSLFDERGSLLGERQSHAVLTLAPERGAILVPPNDAGAVADAVARYATEPELFQAARQANRDRVAERFLDHDAHDRSLIAAVNLARCQVQLLFN